MQSPNMNVLSVAPYTGQFGSILDVKNINSLLLPFRVEKELEENASTKFALIKHLINYVLLGQKLIWPNICLNLSNINVLPKVLPLYNISDSNNVVRKNPNEITNLNVSLVNQLMLNPGALNVLKEFGVISNRHYADIQLTIDQNNTNKKRDAPDFDDYHVIRSKRIKSCENQREVDNVLDTFQQGYTAIETSGREGRSDPFQIINHKWNVDQISNPHINHTHCVHIPVSLQHDQWNQSYVWQNQSCLLFFDEEITKLDITLSNLSRDIFRLCKQYDMCRSFEINEKIRRLKQQENTLQNKYAALCDSRDEIYQLYVNKKRSPLNFNAEFTSFNEINLVKINRDMLNSFNYHYSA